MAYYRVLRILLLLHVSSYCCYSQNLEQLLFDSVREAVGEIKALSERVTDMDTRFTSKFTELETHMKANTLELQGGLELLQGQLVELQESSKSDNLLTIFKEILKGELRQMECSSVEQISNLTVLLGKDECSERSHDCSPFAICEDTIVSYRCNCFSGYFGDGFTCEDIDECITGEARCHDDAQCINLPGNYTCDCSLGFSGDGFHCEEVPPCVSPSKIVPFHGCLTPVKQMKTWMEAKANCEDQGLILLEGLSSKNELDELHTHFYGYFGENCVWIGMYQWKWSESGDPTPSDSLLWNGDDPDLGTNQECGGVCFQNLTSVDLFDNPCDANRYSICQRKTKK